MVYATKIRMRRGCENSNTLLEIESIYLEGGQNPGWITKGDVYDRLKLYPGSIKVNISPFPNLIPEKSSSGEKYVKSTPNQLLRDNLLSLTRA